MIRHVVLASDSSPRFLNFWPLAAVAWREIIGIEPVLAYVTTDPQCDPLLGELRKWGEVRPLRAMDGIPAGNQAKLARFFVASTLKDGGSVIEDIDTAPLSDWHFQSLEAQRIHGKLLAVGREVYLGGPHAGNFPISNLMGDADGFSDLFNINEQTFEQFVLKIFTNFHKAPRTDPSARGTQFSDEWLIRRLIEGSKGNTTLHHVRRGLESSLEVIDRSDWKFEPNRLNSGAYAYANFPRPLHQFKSQVGPVVEVIMGERASHFMAKPLLPLSKKHRRRIRPSKPWLCSLP